MQEQGPLVRARRWGACSLLSLQRFGYYASFVTRQKKCERLSYSAGGSGYRRGMLDEGVKARQEGAQNNRNDDDRQCGKTKAEYVYSEAKYLTPASRS